ncbi:MAG: DUF2934 domain-containing protein [Methylophilaceae bacterium]
MKSSEAPRQLTSNSASRTVSQSASGKGSSALESIIAVATYYRAEAQGFAPGDELDDWLKAEVRS